MRSNKLALVGVLAMSIVAATGCSAGNTEKTATPSDPSQGASSQEQAGNLMQATVYAADDHGFVVPVNIKMGQTKEIARATLEHMVQGGSGDAALTSTGLKNVIPKGTQIRGLSIDKTGVATVDFTKSLLSYKTEQEEHEIVDSVVWALTGINGIQKVQFEIEGKKQATLPQGTPIADPISRDNGINLQMADNTNPSDSTKLTLYFEGANSAGTFNYLVPITRIVPKAKDDNMVKLTMQELAKGPNVDGLDAVLEPTLTLVKSDIKDKVATLDLANNFKLTGTSQEKDMINSIVLSVSANANVNQVKFTVGGKAPAAATNAAKGLDLTKPVTVPKSINDQKL